MGRSKERDEQPVCHAAGPNSHDAECARLLSVIGSWALRRLMIALELTLDAAEIAELDAATEAWRVTG